MQVIGRYYDFYMSICGLWCPRRVLELIPVNTEGRGALGKEPHSRANHPSLRGATFLSFGGRTLDSPSLARFSCTTRSYQLQPHLTHQVLSPTL